MIKSWFSQTFLKTFSLLSHDFLITFPWLSLAFLMTLSWISNFFLNFVRIVLWLSQYFVINFLEYNFSIGTYLFFRSQTLDKLAHILKFLSREDYSLLSNWGLQLLCFFRLMKTPTLSGSEFSWSWEVWCVVRDLVEICSQARGSSRSLVTVRASPLTDRGYTWVLFGAVSKMSCIPVLLLCSGLKRLPAGFVGLVSALPYLLGALWNNACS